MSLRLNFTFFIILSVISISVSAQQMLGTTLGNYAGVNGLKLNPSSLHNSKTYLDIQLVAMDVFVQNNYLYLDKADYRFLNFFKSGYQWPTHAEDYGTEQRIFYPYTNEKDKNAFVQTRIDGPGAMLIWGHHAIALTTAVRTIVSLDNVPYELANFLYLGFNYVPQQNINYSDKGPLKGSGMVWGEIGVSYSYTFYAHRFSALSGGISVKRLLGVGGMYLDARSLEYKVLNDSTIDIKNLDAEMGLSLPIDYNSNTDRSAPLFKGGGFGFDLGLTYSRLKRYHQKPDITSPGSQEYEDYIYRIGVALIDIGRVKFKDNSSKIVIDNRSAYWQNLMSIKYSTIDQLIDTLSYRFYGDTTSAWAGNSFNVWLPSALSVQFDYHLKQNWYINTSLIYGFSMSKGSMVRPAELSVTPRYETRWFEASMPVSLYNWQLARIGLALRAYGLTIGTDKLGGFFHFSDFTGLDFYMSLKLFFRKGNFWNKKKEQCGGTESVKRKN